MHTFATGPTLPSPYRRPSASRHELAEARAVVFAAIPGARERHALDCPDPAVAHEIRTRALERAPNGGPNGPGDDDLMAAAADLFEAGILEYDAAAHVVYIARDPDASDDPSAELAKRTRRTMGPTTPPSTMAESRERWERYQAAERRVLASHPHLAARLGRR